VQRHDDEEHAGAHVRQNEQPDAPHIAAPPHPPPNRARGRAQQFRLNRVIVYVDTS
jgi:hypothetical protein